MKKWIYRICGVLVCMSILAGCSSDNNAGNDIDHTVTTMADGTQINDTFNAQMMTTLDGTSFLLNPSGNWFIDPEMGFGVTNTEPVLKGLNDGQVGGNVMFPYGLALFYLPADVAQRVKDAEGLSEEEQNALIAEMEQKSFFFSGVCRVPKNDKEAETTFAEFSKLYERTEKIAEAFDSTYYFGYNDNIDAKQYSETDKATLQTLLDDREEFKNKLFLYPPTEASKANSGFGGNFQQFETQTITGETVNQDIFKEYDLTMVNVWATWCNPCVAEIPELVELSKALPENVNIISIAADDERERDLVQEMTEHFAIPYPVLLPSDSLQASVLGYVTSLPTTFFVDKEGNVVGEPIIGVPGRSGEILERYQQEIHTRLESIKK